MVITPNNKLISEGRNLGLSDNPKGRVSVLIDLIDLIDCIKPMYLAREPDQIGVNHT
jgi:hypothetical protein